MAKATHMGTCQVCGSLQKLPGGRLATHGYTTRWGFFSGICEGSGHLPFEQSTDVISGAIVRADERAATARLAAKLLRNDKTPAIVWVNEYVGATWENRKSGYIWRGLRREEITLGYRTTWTGKDGKKQQGTTVYGSTAGDADSIAHYLNEQRAVAYEKTAAKFSEYSAWQRERIKNWAPQPLKNL